ncbi:MULTISPECIES: hypothetical protein [unclassified Actinoplanes]|uniref:hypothetical protein n=1 Tax=unclassified Actinoplanes TaxID=2626549 RepID=UPI0012BA81D8|nr:MULTISPECIES: hypothetical protein [unclassified Actinoplanes]
MRHGRIRGQLLGLGAAQPARRSSAWPGTARSRFQSYAWGFVLLGMVAPAALLLDVFAVRRPATARA